MNTGTRNAIAFYSIIALITIMAVMQGCAGLQVKQNDLVMELVVKSATAEYLRQNPEHARTIADITGTASVRITSNQLITIDELDSFVRAKANLDSLAPETQLMANMLIHRVKVAIINKLAQRGITDARASMVQAGIILEWVTETARAYARDSRS